MTIKRQYLKKISFILLQILLLTLSGIFIVNAFQSETGYFTIRPQVYSGVLSNPGIGFTTMGAFDGEVDGYPESTIAYFRWYWDEIMPAMDEGKMHIIVAESKLSQNYPNPFNSGTTIDYQLNISSNVEIKIYNIEGQLIKLLIGEYKPSGYYSVTWNGTNDNGIKVPSGIYIYRLKAGEFYEKSKKMVYLK